MAGTNLLHQFEDGGHARALELRQDLAALEQVVDHLRVGLEAADEVGAGAAQLLHQFVELAAELGADADERQFSLLRPVRRRRLEQTCRPTSAQITISLVIFLFPFFR